MAGDQGIANAYSQYFQAQEMDNLQSDPFYVFTQLATQAAQEWTFEKKKDKERAQKKGEAMQDNIDEMFITASDGYNQQGKDLMHSTMQSFADQMDFAVQGNDKKAMNRVAMDAQTVASEFKRGQAILKDHSAALANGDYSEGAGTATLNKLLAGGEEDYAVYMETDPEKPNYLKPFFQIKNNSGAVSLLSFDDLDKGNVRRADDFGGGYDKLIKGMVKEAGNTGVHEFDAGQVERLLDKQLANTDVMYSSFHDNIFGEQQSIKNIWDAEHKGSNQDWQNMWNDEIASSDEAITGTIQNSGFNEDQMRTYTKTKLMSMAEKEYNMRLKAYQKKVSASKNNNGGNKDKFQYDEYKWLNRDVAKKIANDIKSDQKVIFEGAVYTPDGNGGYLDGNGNELSKNDLISTLDRGRGYGFINDPLFSNLIKPIL
jgi:hypothetical protein